MTDMYAGFLDRVTDEAPECPVTLETVDRTNGVVVYLGSRTPDPAELEQIKATNSVRDGLELTLVTQKWYDREAAERHFLIDGHRFDPSSRTEVSDEFIAHLKIAVDISRRTEPSMSPREAFEVIIENVMRDPETSVIEPLRATMVRADFRFEEAPCFVDCDRTEAERLLTEHRRSWLIRPSSYASTEFYQTETDEYAPSYAHLVFSIRIGSTLTHRLIGHRFGERYDRLGGSNNRLWSEPTAADCLDRLLREAFPDDRRFLIDNYYTP